MNQTCQINWGRQRAKHGSARLPVGGIHGMATVEQLFGEKLHWVHWFNDNQLLEPIGYIPLAEAEANHRRNFASEVTQMDLT